MADKKYYYLQLESSLFSNMKMMMLDRQKDKKELLYFLIQLSVMSIENEGKIMLDDEPASIETLSLLTGEDEKDIEKWIIILMKLKLVSNINGTYLVDFASERIGSITDRALRKQKEKLRNSEGTIKELGGTKAEQVPHSSEELPQYKSKSKSKSKSYNKELDKESDKELELKKDKKIKKDIKIDKEEKALLEKDAVEVYSFYVKHIKSGRRGEAIKLIQDILKDNSKEDLIICIQNYIIKQKETGVEIKYYNQPQFFFSKANEKYKDFLGYDLNGRKMFIEEAKAIDKYKGELFVRSELTRLRDKYINVITEEDVKEVYNIFNDEVI